MPDVPTIVLNYVRDSDMLEDKLSDIAMSLQFNIKSQLTVGHGRDSGDLLRSIQSNYEMSDGLNGVVTAESNTFYDEWVNEGHTLRNGEWWEGYHFMEAGLEATVAMYK